MYRNNQKSKADMHDRYYSMTESSYKKIRPKKHFNSKVRNELIKNNIKQKHYKRIQYNFVSYNNSEGIRFHNWIMDR